MTSRKYAEGSTVSVDRSLREIRSSMESLGAFDFAHRETSANVSARFRPVSPGDEKPIETAFEPIAELAFRVAQEDGIAVGVRMRLPLPDPWGDEFRLTATGRERSERSARDAYEAELRRRWRALALIVKAKRVAIEAGITTFEREYLGDLILATGERVEDALRDDRLLPEGAGVPMLPEPEPDDEEGER
jgi:hypothetical protein